MMAVGLDEETLRPYLDQVASEVSHGLSIACVNSRRNLTISGHGTAVDRLAELLHAEKQVCKKLSIPVAYHSPQMTGVAEQYAELLGRLDTGTHFGPGRDAGVVMFSTVRVGEVSAAALVKPQYWVDNLTCPVRFADGLAAMCSAPTGERRRLRVDRGTGAPIQHLVEVGPHAALQSAVRETLATEPTLAGIEYAHMLKRGGRDVESALRAAGKLFCSGFPVNLAAVNRCRPVQASRERHRPAMLVDLPPYSFHHGHSYWPESRFSRNFRFRKHGRHDLLGAPVTEWNAHHPEWRQVWRLSENPWLKDHKVTGRIVFPGVGYLVMALEAARQLHESDKCSILGFRLRDVSFKVALQIPEGEEGVETVIGMPFADESSLKESSAWRRFKIRSYNASSDDWTEHCRGLIHVETCGEDGSRSGSRQEAGSRQEVQVLDVAEARRICTTRCDMKKAYSELESVGLGFGPLFRNLTGVFRGEGQDANQALGTVTVPDVRAVMPKKHMDAHMIHPVSMDSMMHVFLAALTGSAKATKLAEAMVPVFLRELWVAREVEARPGATFLSVGVATKAAHKRFDGVISVYDPDTGCALASFQGIQFVPIPSASTAAQRQLNFRPEWKADMDLIDPRQCGLLLRRQLDLGRYEPATVRQVAEAFNLGSIAYIAQAMDQLKDDDATRFPAHLQRYYGWMQHQMALYASGKIMHQRADWSLVVKSASLRERLFAELEKTGPEGRLTNRMGSKIVPILRQEADALQLMFGDDLLEAYYRELHGVDVIHQLLQAYLEAYSVKRADLAVLEVGAGTGGTTVPALQTLCPLDGLSRLSKYTFTDISPAFFEKAKPKLRRWLGVLDFRRLDIEKDLAAQGFGEGQQQYDLVLASNVLHATESIASALKQVKALLKPGGKLLLHEAVNAEFLGGSLAFGLLPGWWRGREETRRLWPILDEKQWDAELKAAGFTGTDLLLPDHVGSHELHAQSLMVATVPAPRRMRRHGPETAVLVLHSTAQAKLAAAVSHGLEPHGLPVRTLSHNLLSDCDGAEFKNSIVVSLLELDEGIFRDMDEDEFQAMRPVLTRCAGLLWATDDHGRRPEAAMSSGLIRSLRWERDLEDCNLVSLSFETEDTSAETRASQLSVVFDYQFVQDNMDQRHAEYKVSDGGVLLINRLDRAHELDAFLGLKLGKPVARPQAFGARPRRALRLTTDSPGLLNRLQFADCPVHPTPLGPHDVEVEMHATGLNFRDIMSAMGEVAGETLGAEGAGIVSRVGADVSQVEPGDRVMLLASHTGCFHSHARTVDAAVLRLPSDVTFASAAGMPVTACTAYYSLFDLARLSRGESVLIHAGAGGVGQAAIMLAQHVGADIFATVSTPEKAKMLQATYGIPEDHILPSRDTSFARAIMRLTKDRGVDVVLNSLAGESLRLSWHCIAPFGRFVEIGKRDIYANGQLDMFPFSRNVTFASCDLETVMRLDTAKMARLMGDVMRLMRQGVLRDATPLHVLPYSQLEAGFRLLQSGKHMGKIVLTAGQEDVVPVVPPPLPEYRFPDQATYLLSGGLGGIGRSIAQWMASRGARHLVFLSRRGAHSEPAQDLLSALHALGVQTAAFACDVSDAAQVRRIVADCSRTMPPIKGCIQAAMQLKDSALETMPWSSFRAAVLPKVHGSWNLHEALPRDMHFFIMLSSICGIIGNRGQANYAAGNTYQDALAHYRRRHGLAATAIDLGSMLSVGFIAEHAQTTNPYAVAAETIREDELHAILEFYVDPGQAATTAGQPQVAVGLTTKAAFQTRGVPEPSFLRQPLFTLLRSSAAFAATDADEESFAAARAALRAVRSLPEAALLVADVLARRLAGVMGLPPDDVDPARPVHYYGVDSLVAVEFRNWLAKTLEADVEVLDIMGDDSLAVLSERIARASKLVPPELKSENEESERAGEKGAAGEGNEGEEVVVEKEEGPK